jgi:hypothetical protein
MAGEDLLHDLDPPIVVLDRGDICFGDDLLEGFVEGFADGGAPLLAGV